jgi:parallel beta-helix repeat protein
MNGIGASQGTDNTAYLPANGIMLDENTSAMELDSNSVANCTQYGILLHNAHEITVNNNILYNNASAQLRQPYGGQRVCEWKF